ncbi:DUF2341 domain-containing protein [Candidatus Micrarchaeota archaeon]|nr:DUF2341 domain-containing protein [Candidatus Micrarchaeota archaeon]MBU1681767.1 DUF2341 domain-containing protein [Candidatus Micrarchaeota archaeon]
MNFTKPRTPEKKERRKNKQKFNSVSKLAVEAIICCNLISCGGDKFQTSGSLAADASADHFQSDAGAVDSETPKDSAPEAALESGPKDAAHDVPDSPVVDAPGHDSPMLDSAVDATVDSSIVDATDSSVDATQDSASDSNSVLAGYSFCRTVTSSDAVTLPSDYTHEISFSGNQVDFETLTVLSGTCEAPDSERGFFVDGDTVFVRSETPDELSYAFAYGNPAIQNQSSGEAAFLFFEDFEAPVLDMSKWSVDTGSDPGNCGTQNFSINGGIFQIEAKSSTVYSCEHAIATKETFSPPVKLEFFDLKHPNWGGTGDSGYYRNSTEGFEGSTERAYFTVNEHGRLTYANASQSPDNSFFDPANPFDLTLVWKDDQAQPTVNGTDGYPAVFDTPASSLSIRIEVSNWKVTKPSGKSELGEIRLKRWVSEDPTYNIGVEQSL